MPFAGGAYGLARVSLGLWPGNLPPLPSHTSPLTLLHMHVHLANSTLSVIIFLPFLTLR